MAADIYYFTGTGNSLAIARQIGAKIENSKIISIPRAMPPEQIEADDILGIVCPIYMYNIPWLVVDFIKKIKNAPYIFIVFAGGGEPGAGMNVVRKLFEAQGLALSAAFNVAMPSNYAPYGETPAAKREKRFQHAEDKLDTIIKTITAKETLLEKSPNGFFKSHIIPGMLYKLGYKFINKMDGSFIVEDQCNGCGTCEKVCPVNNISLIDGKPQWHSRCQQCYACLQWCPQEAIQYGKKTAGVPRYHHPDVTLKDIIAAAAR